MHKIILASKSPRRSELLRQIGVSFTCDSAEVEETLDPSLSFEVAMEQLAKRKAEAVAKKQKDAIVIGADTMVFYQGKRLGKPKDEQEAKHMLQLLSGKTHVVITAVAILYQDKEIIWHTKSEVTFYPLQEEEILAYVASKEPMDKAGAYAIQGKGAIFVAKIEGDYYNIVGLPVAQVYRALEKLKAEADIV